jgi:hypothetical protein
MKKASRKRTKGRHVDITSLPKAQGAFVLLKGIVAPGVLQLDRPDIDVLKCQPKTVDTANGDKR